MRPWLGLLLALFVLGAAPAKDWRENVVESADGWTFGRPGAPLLTEYASFGCPHCAHFAEATGDRIGLLVKAGKLRFSFRPYRIFPHDQAATVLARCVPAPRRLAFIEALMASQADTKARLAAADADDASRGRLYTAELAGPVPHAQAIAEITGLTALAAAHGADADRCLADARHHDWTATADLTARAAGVTGTPTYFWKEARLPRGLTPESLLATLPQ